MAKRSLCLLLALATVFSLAAPAFADGEPIEEPLETPVPTEEPVEVTEAPVEVTEEPVIEATEEPAVPEGPVEATEEPAPVEEPEAAPEVPVEATGEPVIPEEPVVPEEPVQVPEEPAAPEIVEEPEPAAVDEPMPAADIPNAGSCGDSGDNVKWTLSDDGTLTISGTGKMKDYYSGTNASGVRPPWYSEEDPFQSAVKNVVIQPGVTSIGKGAFFGCQYMTSVTIPDGVTSIGDQAFWTCARLTSVTFPGSLTSIGDGAFLSCGLTSLTIPDSVTAIGDSAFDGCDMTSVTLPASVTSIGDYVFQHCSSLKSITIPESVTSIGEAAFQYDTSLESVTIPASVTSIGAQAFVGCTGLKSATVLNPECVLSRACFYGFGVIYGYDGSTAEAFAKENDHAFESLGTAPTPTAAPTAKPAQPKVSKVTNAANGVTITWKAVDGAATYTVYSKTGTGKWKKVGDTAETSYTWTKAKSGTKYSFSVSATNDLGSSKYNKTGKSITYVAAPKVKSAKIDASGVKITWGKVNGAAKYQVMYKTGDGAWKVLAKSATGTSYTWKKAKSGTKYTFSVRAVGKDGSTGAYNETGKSLTYIAAPKVKSAKKVSGGVKITWGKVNGAAEYQVMYKVGNGKWKQLTATDKRTFTWKKAKNGTKYTFSVRAVTVDGTKGVYNTTGKSLTYKK